ncbi:MAG: DUF362 domain-containing protein [Candidatus Thorarchaeota archaeon]
MLTQSKSKKPEVVITKGNTPKESLLKGIENLGGISSFINDGDQVFIKFNLNLPGGFPLNTNFEILKEIVILCKEARAKKVYLGSFPVNGIPIKFLSDILNLEIFFQTLGAELVFFDNSDYYINGDFNSELLKKVKRETLTGIKTKSHDFLVPNIILNSNKFISVNQVNVNPLFKLNLSILNSYSIIPSNYREINTNLHNIKSYISADQYKTDLTSKILDIFAIRKPDLVINDLFYILEGAGPFIYKDSEIRKTGMMIIGNDAISVDLVTLNLLNLRDHENILIKHAQEKNLRVPDLSNISLSGEKFEESIININQCVSTVQEIKLPNFCIKSGKICSGCFAKAYHLLNFMKTYMVKDLKYNINNYFLIGENPPEPDIDGNILLFGDCSINSTKNDDFRRIIKKTTKKSIQDVKKKLLKEKGKKKKRIKVKEKINKNILEIHGCPPKFYNCLELILKYYGKKNVPNLNFFMEVNRYWINGKMNENLKLWEEL